LLKKLTVLSAGAVLAIAGLVVLAGCGSGGSKEQPTEQPSVEPTQTQTVETLPTVDPNVDLTDYRSPDKGYSLGYPQGWEKASVGSLDQFLVKTESGKVAAQLTVNCLQAGSDWTPEFLMTVDASAAHIAGQVQLGQVTDVEVDGVAGKERRYSIDVQGLTIEHVAAYVIHGDCGWRIGLNSYGQGTLAPYVPLFDRILASFRFLS
jgi:hypothetical protein